MEVHAHTHTPRKKWTHYFWEFLMLFLAVTLGFFVENQREHYIEKQRAKQLAASLTIDLGIDIERLSNVIFSRNAKKEKFDTLMNELEKAPGSQNDSLIFHITAENLLNRSNVVPNTGTYQQIKNSGSLRYFETGIAADLILYQGNLETLDRSFEFDDDYLLGNVVKLRSELCNPKYLRLKREQKTFIVSEPMISKNASIQLDLYKALNFLQERNQVYLRQMTAALGKAESLLSKLKKTYSIK